MNLATDQNAYGNYDSTNILQNIQYSTDTTTNQYTTTGYTDINSAYGTSADQYNNIETNNYNITKKLLKYRLCNETSMVNMPSNYKISLPLNQLFCIDKDDILFGGNWNHDFLNYLEVNLYLCEDGVPFNSSDPNIYGTNVQ